jgi:cobalt-zinc-cadmium efflux system membrane fusion protein
LIVKTHKQPRETGDETPFTLVDGSHPGTFELPLEVAKGLGLASQVIAEKAQGRPLELSGSLAFDPDHLGRIQSRLPGEVVELGKNHEPNYDPAGSGRTETERALRYGDRVHQSDLMAVVWSKDLGGAKSDLVDALVQLDLDRETLNGLEQLLREGNAPEATVRVARSKVSSDLNAVSRAERILRTWRVSKKEIDAVRAEAQRVIQRKGVHDQAKERDWARVEVRAPFDGVVVEKNGTVGNIVDTSFDLYKIAWLDQLAVYVNACLRGGPAGLAGPPGPGPARAASDPLAGARPGLPHRRPAGEQRHRTHRCRH